MTFRPFFFMLRSHACSMDTKLTIAIEYPDPQRPHMHCVHIQPPFLFYLSKRCSTAHTPASPNVATVGSFPIPLRSSVSCPRIIRRLPSWSRICGTRLYSNVLSARSLRIIRPGWQIFTLYTMFHVTPLHWTRNNRFTIIRPWSNTYISAIATPIYRYHNPIRGTQYTCN